MNILVLNSGSSSIKYQLFRWPAERPVCSGLVERVGSAQATITHQVFDLNTPAGPSVETQLTLPLADHEAGPCEVVRLLTAAPSGVIEHPADVAVVGHRVVHGGESFTAATFITAEVKSEIQRLFGLAPLHNPANYAGIEVAERVFAQARQVAVFDTAFHHTLPEYAFRCALPTALCTEQRIRNYGFHGTSHQYVAAQAAAYLKARRQAHHPPLRQRVQRGRRARRPVPRYQHGVWAFGGPGNGCPLRRR
ncbi:hypothetical protein [Hymenobacter coccineus]|uniref:hypothetical protein n=1 Tax=Hymenobacter coccineus TaxID=1908235 RepID=UPI000A6158AA|nr:hypothetical protein [Hymenobacter coccineus]